MATFVEFAYCQWISMYSPVTCYKSTEMHFRQKYKESFAAKQICWGNTLEARKHLVQSKTNITPEQKKNKSKVKETWLLALFGRWQG